MKKPFQEYSCAVCGKKIPVEDGMLHWLQKKTDENDTSSLETLVDIHICCRRKPCNRVFENRAINEGLHEQWDHLDSFVGTDKIDNLLTFPIERIVPRELYKKYLDILRRLSLPYYEEARLYFSRADSDGYIENVGARQDGYFSWEPQTLKNIIDEYTDEDL